MDFIPHGKKIHHKGHKEHKGREKEGLRNDLLKLVNFLFFPYFSSLFSL
jgi:hypothetical protein